MLRSFRLLVEMPTQLPLLWKVDSFPGEVEAVDSLVILILNACQRTKMGVLISLNPKWFRLLKIKTLKKYLVEKLTLLRCWGQDTFTPGELVLVDNLVIQTLRHSQLMRMVTLINQSQDVWMLLNSTNWLTPLVVTCIQWFLQTLERFTVLEVVLADSLGSVTFLPCL